MDGVFYYRDPEVAPDCADELPPPRPFFILRFFPDGTVTQGSVISDDLHTDWERIGTWLNERHSQRGNYQLTGDVISFSIQSESGRVDYFGVVKPEALTLSWRSHINGSIRNALEYVRL